MSELATEVTLLADSLSELATEVTPTDGPAPPRGSRPTRRGGEVTPTDASPAPRKGRGRGRGRGRGKAAPVVKRGSVSRESDVKSVAGFIAMTLRNDGRVELLAAGPRAVNRAVKAVCLARKFLDADSLDLVVDPAFQGTDVSPASNEVCLRVRAVPPRAERPGDVEFNVAKTSTPGAVAGAVAAAVRRGDPVTAFAMGEQAVTRGLKACWKAGLFLADEKRGPTFAIEVAPEFCAPDPDDTFSTKIAFRVLADACDFDEATVGDDAGV